MKTKTSMPGMKRKRIAMVTKVGRPARMAGMHGQIKGLSKRLDEIPFPE